MKVIAVYYRFGLKYQDEYETISEAASSLFWGNDEGELWPEEIRIGDEVVWRSHTDSIDLIGKIPEELLALMNKENEDETNKTEV